MGSVIQEVWEGRVVVSEGGDTYDLMVTINWGKAVLNNWFPWGFSV